MDTIGQICKLVMQFIGTLCQALGQALGPLGTGILALVAGGGIAGASLTGTGTPGQVPGAPGTSLAASPTATGAIDPNSITDTVITSAPAAPKKPGDAAVDPTQVTGLKPLPPGVTLLGIDANGRPVFSNQKKS